MSFAALHGPGHVGRRPALAGGHAGTYTRRAAVNCIVAKASTAIATATMSQRATGRSSDQNATRTARLATTEATLTLATALSARLEMAGRAAITPMTAA